MTRSKSEHPSKTPADIAARYPEIPSIESSIEEIEIVLISLSFARWVATDVEFANLGERVLQLRAETFALIDRLEPLIMIGAQSDATASAALRAAGIALGKIEQLVDDMSLSIRREVIGNYLGSDAQPDRIKQVLTEIGRITTVVDAFEDSNELSLTLKSFFQETLDWLEGILFMFGDKLEVLDEPLSFYKSQLDDEFSPAEKEQFLIEIDRITALKNEYTKALKLVEEMIDTIRKKQRYHESNYQEPNQYDDDESLDDDDWPIW